MTVSQSLLERYYPDDWTHSVRLSNHAFIFPLDDHAKLDAISIRTLFAASAGALYVYRPSKKRRILNRAIEQLEESGRMLAQLLLVTPSDFSSRINYM